MFSPLITWRKPRPLQNHPTKQKPATTQNSWNCPCWQNTETAHQLGRLLPFCSTPQVPLLFAPFTRILARRQVATARRRSFAEKCMCKQTLSPNKPSKSKVPTFLPRLCPQRQDSFMSFSSRSASLENFQIFQLALFTRGNSVPDTSLGPTSLQEWSHSRCNNLICFNNMLINVAEDDVVACYWRFAFSFLSEWLKTEA